MKIEQTMGTLQMVRTNPAHAGTSPLRDVNSFGKAPVEKTERKQGAFESYLLGAVDTVNNQQLNVDRLAQQYITDPESVNVEDVTVAMAKAQQSLSLAQTVIDRITTGWNELSTTR
ncbi:MAG: flagellar hook-basal body complex protein FliE [Treponema sp.]|nr:flagellar hook-basal body complex protein FliE [Treponema sp.]